MKKSTKITLISLSMVITFGIGTYAGATSSWSNDVINDAYSKISRAGYDKKEQLIKNTDDKITNKVKSDFANQVEDKKDSVEQQLENYYNQKLDGVKNTTEYKNTEKQIDNIEQGVVDSYKKEIDQAFNK